MLVSCSVLICVKTTLFVKLTLDPRESPGSAITLQFLIIN
jgi:hypothetical protein